MTDKDKNEAPYSEDHYTPPGILVAIGGNEDKENDVKIIRAVVDVLESKNLTIEVITTASEIPEETGKKYMTAFDIIGVKYANVMLIKNREDAERVEYVDRIKKANIVYFTGGDQLKITSILGGSRVLETIIKKYRNEKCVIAGTSAGASALSEVMVYEGESQEALTKGTVQITAGLGLVTKVVIDSHFIKRGRFSRLMEVVTCNPGHIGLGLGEDSGVIIREGHVLEAIGNGLIVIFDGQHIKYSNVSKIDMGEAIAVEKVIVHTLVKGYGYDLQSRRYIKPEYIQKGDQ
jgi:cyanophycinase